MPVEVGAVPGTPTSYATTLPLLLPPRPGGRPTVLEVTATPADGVSISTSVPRVLASTYQIPTRPLRFACSTMVDWSEATVNALISSLVAGSLCFETSTAVPGLLTDTR